MHDLVSQNGSQQQVFSLLLGVRQRPVSASTLAKPIHFCFWKTW